MFPLGGEIPCAWKCEVVVYRGSGMKRFRGRGKDRLGLLQLLEVEGPSSDGDKYGEQELEPKHKIFLSHSGVQKDFTEQLCVDLGRSHYYPFFDKRPDSLRKGKRFPALIFKAAQQCRVAVLILSEDFFTRSKWPMLELEAFVEAQKKDREKIDILPVYLTLSRDECTKNEALRSKWVDVWRKWGESDDRINVEKWVDALRVLGPSNGIEYEQSLGEVTLREQIVNAVQDLVAPEITWSGEQIEGKTRICKVIRKKIQTTKPSAIYGVRIVGIHGMGGVGKTTFCKVLCDELWSKFQGKVCHGELGSKSPIELQKQVLRDLTDVNRLEHLYDDSRTTNLLKEYIRRQRVFLALDNITHESLEEAKVFLEAGFHTGSIVVVTARSIELLERLKIDRGSYLEMPEFEEHDAQELFLHHAGLGVKFQSEAHKKSIQYCVRQCQFSKGEGNATHFHPLALKVLGAQLGSLEMDPRNWVEYLRNLPKEDKFNQFGDKEHPIFNVLRIGYDSLLDEDKLLFIDVSLMCPHLILESSKIHDNILQHGIGRSLGSDQLFSNTNIFEWLSIVHGTTVWRIKNRVQGLKAKALLENIGDVGVSIHDLYIEFAEMEVKRGALDTRSWVWCDRGESSVQDLALMPSGNCWQNIKRVHLYMSRLEYESMILWRNFNHETIGWSGNIEGIKWQHFSNIVVLHLFCIEIKLLDLRGFQCLRSLGLECERGMEEEGCKLIGLAELKELAWLDVRNIGTTSYLKEIYSLTALKVLNLWERNFERKILWHSSPKLDKCIALQELVLQQFSSSLKAFPDLSNLTSLRMIVFRSCSMPKEVVGLHSQMRSLQVLSVSDCPSLSHISGLDDLVALQELTVEECGKWKLPLNLCKLTNMQRLILQGKFKKVLGFNELMPLHDLELGGVEELHDLHLLRCLQKLCITRFSAYMLPRFGNFTTLEDLEFYDLQEVGELPDMHELSRLQRLGIWKAPKLVLELPVLGDLVALEELRLGWCGTSMGRAELPDLCRLTNLKVLTLYRTPIRSLPSLERLTQLTEFNCSFTLLSELPNLSGSILMEFLDIYECRELTSVGNLAIMPALVELNAFGCDKLERLPDLTSLKSLRTLELHNTRVRLSPEDIIFLATSKVSFQSWENFGASNRYSVSEIEAMQSKYFSIHETTTGSVNDDNSGD